MNPTTIKLSRQQLIIISSAILLTLSFGLFFLLFADTLKSSNHTNINLTSELAGINGPYQTNKFSIIVPTYKRDYLLRDLMKYYQQCSNLIEAIHIQYNQGIEDNDPLPTDLITENEKFFKVFVWKVPKSLNSRFLLHDKITTEAVFELDDDIRIDCNSLKMGFEAWQIDKTRMVGFVPRLHREKDDGKLEYYFDPKAQQYSLILTGACFLHQKYLHEYHHVMDKRARDVVDELFNCEDIAMNFYVQNKIRKPGLYIEAKVRNVQHNVGISHKPGYFDRRNVCMNKFKEIYGYNPLIWNNWRITMGAPNDMEYFKLQN